AGPSQPGPTRTPLCWTQPGPAHLIHWIHFNHSMREPSAVIPVTAEVGEDGMAHSRRWCVFGPMESSPGAVARCAAPLRREGGVEAMLVPLGRRRRTPTGSRCSAH